MEILGLVDVPGWIVCILILIFTVCIYTWHKQSYFTRLGIKTKPTVFFLGDIGLMLKKGFSYIDEHMVEKYGKVFGTYVGNVPALAIHDTKMLKQILVKDFAKFTDRPLLVPFKQRVLRMVNMASGTHWKFLRSTLSPTFSTGKIRNMCTFINRCSKTFAEIIDDHIKDYPEGFDIDPIIRGYTMDVTCSTAFGIDVDAQRNPDNPFVKRATQFGSGFGARGLIFFPKVWFPCFSFIWDRFTLGFVSDDAWSFFKNATKEAFNDRTENESKQKDFLQLLINAHKGSEDDDHSNQLSYEELKNRGLTFEEVVSNSVLFIIAGFDTTATTLDWLVYEMVLNPDCQEKMREEIESDIGQNTPEYEDVFKLSYMDMFVNETLRMHAPSGRLNRLAMEDVDICGVHIEKGMDVSYSPQALHFMAEHWEEPYKFIPERFSPENKHNINEYAYLPFGVGPRNCIGQRLALLEVKMTMVKMLQNFRFHKTYKLEVPMPVISITLTKPAKPVFVKVEKL